MIINDSSLFYSVRDHQTLYDAHEKVIIIIIINYWWEVIFQSEMSKVETCVCMLFNPIEAGINYLFINQIDWCIMRIARIAIFL